MAETCGDCISSLRHRQGLITYALCLEDQRSPAFQPEESVFT